MSIDRSATSAAIVTIVTPAYNAARFIDRCIQSVLAQDYPHWQLVVVDDGSTDDTEARAAQYGDPRIQYIRMPHRGLGALAESYNVALAASQGAYVAILEGDDFWPPDKLSSQVAPFADPEVMLTWGRAIVVDRDDRPVRKWKQSRLARERLPFDRLFRILARKNILTPAVTVMVRRDAIDRIGGFQQRCGAPFVDLPTWLLLTAQTPGVALRVDREVGYYRVHSQQTSNQRNVDMRYAHYEVLQSILEDLDPATRARVGWNRAAERAALASAHWTRGIGRFRSGDTRAALRHFAASVTERLRP